MKNSVSYAQGQKKQQSNINSASSAKQKKIVPPVITSSDDIAKMSDRVLFEQYRSILEDRNVVFRRKRDTTKWDTELAYLKREMKIRNDRISAWDLAEQCSTIDVDLEDYDTSWDYDKYGFPLPDQPSNEEFVYLSKLRRRLVNVKDTQAFVVGNAARSKPLTHDASTVLFNEYVEAGRPQSLRNKIVERNMRLVISIANMYSRRGKGSVKAKLPIEDLVQEGAFGLLKAVERFEPSKGFHFSTYATWWVRQAIGDALSNRKDTIRVPGHAQRLNKQLIQKRSEFVKEFGVEPSADELASLCGTSASVVKATQQASKLMLSLSDPYGAKSNPDYVKTIGDTIPDTAPLPDEVLMREETIKAAMRALESLSPRESTIVRLRYGLDVDSSQSRYAISPEDAAKLEKGIPLK